MRGEYLKQLFPKHNFLVISIDEPIKATARVLRSLGWRYKIGPLIKDINKHIRLLLKGDYAFELVWIDKGVFIDPDIIYNLKKTLRQACSFYTRSRFHLSSVEIIL